MEQEERSDPPEICVTTLGRLLKIKREAAGLSLNKMAAELGISQPYLSRLERGEYRHPSPKTLLRIAKCLHISPEDLYALTGLLPTTDLPSFAPYLRAKYPELPDHAITELDDIRDFLARKYSSR